MFVDEYGVKYPGSEAPWSIWAYEPEAELNVVPLPPTRLVHLEKQAAELVTFSIDHLSGETKINLRLEQLPNIPFIWVTFFVSNDSNRSSVILLHPINIHSILVTEEVLKFFNTDKSCTEEHPENI